MSKNIKDFNTYLFQLELEVKANNSDILTKKSIHKLSNKKILKRYKLLSGFHAGIHEYFPGSGYIDFLDNNIFILSSRGVLAYRINIEDDDVTYSQIKNNIDNFINIKQFNKDKSFSLKDMLISKDKIFISYTEEIKEDCWNTSVIFGEVNYKSLRFEKLFSPIKCIHSTKNIDKEFEAVQSGGRMVEFDNNHILLTIGDYRSRHLAQNNKSINGKIIKINIDNGNHEIISMGHRNQQGLYFDKDKKILLETEHGPKGGDEINIIEINKISNSNNILNYGWAISSAGEHYGGKQKSNKNKYEKYPLFKSHSDHGFIEPIKSFVPSIGISEIQKINKNNYVFSSLKDKSLYFFELNDEKKINNLERIEVFERIRDIGFNQDKLYLFMEDTASIGVINLK
ncbi:PQQ-dependent sugar dehydrogenase [Candidatus Pelagibacter sp.]|nr:PQQ-dependent sugar dehydrogenase [Candidatus Pelagibacter sp.]